MTHKKFVVIRKPNGRREIVTRARYDDFYRQHPAYTVLALDINLRAARQIAQHSAPQIPDWPPQNPADRM